jgi:putative flippase GtrA
VPGPVYLRYVAASGAALAVDFALFMATLSMGVAPAVAAACGYLMGIICHWLLSSRLVFAAQLAQASIQRRQQQALFVGSAFVGLAITMTIVGIGSRYGLDPRLAKIVAIAASFQVTYILRKKVVFAC